MSDFSDDVLEKILFNKICTDAKYIGALSDVFDTRWFENKTIGHLSLLVTKYFKKYNVIPNRKILMALVKKYSEKHTDITVESAQETFIEFDKFNIGLSEEAIKNNLMEYIKRRGLYFSIMDNLEDIEKYQSLDQCLTRFDKFQKISLDNNLGLDYFKDMDKHWDFILNPASKISTGWSGIDEITNGGFLRMGKSLYIFMGQPGLGKSAFLSNIALNFLKQDLSVIVISLEMSEDVYGMRFDAHISNDCINRLNETHVTSKQKIKDFAEQHPNSKLFLKEFPPRTVSSMDITRYIDEVIANGHHIDAIVIDYLNLVRPQHSTSKTTMYEDVLAVSENLRAISYKYSVPVITATQTNTEGIDNENVSMKHAAESRGMAHTVDFMAGLFQTDVDRENGVISVKILKNRLGGKVGKILNMKLNPDTLVLTDISISSADISAGDRLIGDLQAIDEDIQRL